MNRFVYLDNNATTKVGSHIKEKIMPYLELQYGNPSSLYMHGKKIKDDIRSARSYCEDLINAPKDSVIFTGSGSESNCSAFNSSIQQYENKKRIITTHVEHSSILEYCYLLEKKGFDVIYLDVDSNCKISIEQLESVVNDDTCLVSIQFANNEVGTVIVDDEVINKIKNLKSKYDFNFHVDCVQGLGKIGIDVEKIGADLVSFSGHKIHCPKGIGMLYIKNKEVFTPLVTGHQEFNLRGGTENVIGIVAMGESCRYIKENFEDIMTKIKNINKYLEEQLLTIPGVRINCCTVSRIPNTTSVTFENHIGNNVMFKLESVGVCVSTGSACNSESSEPSYVLTSMNVVNPQNTIRVSVDENTTKSQVDYFIEHLKSIIE